MPLWVPLSLWVPLWVPPCVPPQHAERKVSPAMKKIREENVRPFMRPMLFAFSCSEITMDDL